MATQKRPESPPRDACLPHYVQNDTGQWVDVGEKKRKRKNPQNCFYQVCFCSFFSLFLSFVCLHYLCGDFFIRISSSLVVLFLARLQGVNESISSKHVDFCFHGDPGGPTMSPRLRPTDWWKTVLPFSLFYSHCVPLFLLNSPPLLHLLFHYYFSLSLFINL